MIFVSCNDNQTVINADDVETQHVMNETVDAMNSVTESSRASNSADEETMRDEQLNDDTLRGWWSLAKRGKGGFFVKNNLFYRVEKILGNILLTYVYRSLEGLKYYACP